MHETSAVRVPAVLYPSEWELELGGEKSLSTLRSHARRLRLGAASLDLPINGTGEPIKRDVSVDAETVGNA